MSKAEPIPPETLAIRAKPRPVKRFSKTALAALLGSSALVIAVAALVTGALGKRGEAGTARELYSTENKPTAEALGRLPSTYNGVGSARPDPLGPPLPGDLGGPILRARDEGRIIIPERGSVLPAAPDTASLLAAEAAADAEARARAEADAARRSDIFFTNRGGEGQVVPIAGSSPPARTAGFDPMAALALPQTAPFGASALEDPNRQARKLEFLETEGPDAAIYNPHPVETPVSPYQVMAGTIIPATLITGINSDLPGQAIAQVTEPVYDTVTGQFLLIPQGTRIIGRYDSVIAYGQSRVLLVWTRLIFPDGRSLRIDNLPGADARGYAGLFDRTDNHTLRIFAAAALSSLISIGAELGEDEDDDIARAIRESAQDGTSRAGDEIVRRQLSVQPTLTIRPGWRFRILVQTDLVFEPYGD